MALVSGRTIHTALSCSPWHHCIGRCAPGRSHVASWVPHDELGQVACGWEQWSDRLQVSNTVPRLQWSSGRSSRRTPVIVRVEVLAPLAGVLSVSVSFDWGSVGLARRVTFSSTLMLQLPSPSPRRPAAAPQRMEVMSSPSSSSSSNSSCGWRRRWRHRCPASDAAATMLSGGDVLMRLISRCSALRWGRNDQDNRVGSHQAVGGSWASTRTKCRQHPPQCAAYYRRQPLAKRGS